jgi:hypothetical protein
MQCSIRTPRRSATTYDHPRLFHQTSPYREWVGYQANGEDCEVSSEISDFIGEFGEALRTISHSLYFFSTPFNATTRNEVMDFAHPMRALPVFSWPALTIKDLSGFSVAAPPSPS